MSENMSNINYEEYLKQSQGIGNKIDLEKALDKGVNISEMLNVPLRVSSIESRNGMDGEYINMDCIDLRNMESAKLRTGAAIIVSILKNIDLQNQFPVDLAFHLAPDGRTKLIRDIVPDDFNDDLPL